MRNLEPVEIKKIAILAERFVYSSCDRKRDYLPYFTYRLFNSPICIEHGLGDSHVVGRFLDTLAILRETFGFDVDLSFVEGLTRRLYEGLRIGQEKGTGLYWNEPTGLQVDGAVTHNSREAILGLLAGAYLLGSEEAMTRAETLINDIARHTAGTGHFPGSLVTESGWQSVDGSLGGERSKEKDLSFLQGLNQFSDPANTGRMVRALIEFYEVSGYSLALELAHRFAVHNARTCFEPDGTWIVEKTGTHVHSITGTITCLIYAGLYFSDSFLLRVGRAAFDHGSLPYRSSFGWVPEVIGRTHERSEANNVGDILQSALLLAKHVDVGYWDVAEKILRNQLIACQLRDASLFSSAKDRRDTDDAAFENVAERAVGGFFFAAPADLKSFEHDKCPMNTDLVQGAVAALANAYEDATVDDGTSLKVNLLLTKTGPAYSVVSDLPKSGRVEIISGEPRVVLMRIPSWVDKDSIKIRDNITDRELAPEWVGSYLRLSRHPQRTRIAVTFPQAERTDVENVNGKDFKVEWLGDTVVSMKPPKVFFKELYEG